MQSLCFTPPRVGSRLQVDGFLSLTRLSVSLPSPPGLLSRVFLEWCAPEGRVVVGKASWLLFRGDQRSFGAVQGLTRQLFCSVASVQLLLCLGLSW